MHGFGPPADRRARREWWRRQIERQQEGSLSIAEFCRRLGFSAVTFYSWKRRLRALPVVPALSSDKPAAKGSAAKLAPASTFLPVSMLDAGPHGQLEIELANACVVRLKGAVAPALLRVAIRAASRVGGHGQETH